MAHFGTLLEALLLVLLVFFFLNYTLTTIAGFFLVWIIFAVVTPNSECINAKICQEKILGEPG